MEVYIAKCDTTLNVDWDSLPKTTQQYVIAYGLTQSLSDAAASESMTKELNGARVALEGTELDAARDRAMGLVKKRLDALREGKIPSGGGGKRLDFDEQAKRNVMTDYLVSVGFKKAEATILSRNDLDEIMPAAIAVAFKRAHGRDGTEEEIAERVKRNLPKIDNDIGKEAVRLRKAAESRAKLPTIDV